MSYGKVEQSFFKMSEVKALSFGAKSLLLYYLTNHHRNFTGVYYIPHVYALDDLNLTMKEHEKYFSELIKAGQVMYDEVEKVIFVPSNLLHNPLTSSTQITGAQKLLKDIKSKEILQAFMELAQNDTLSDYIRYRIDTPSIPYRYRANILSIEVEEEVKEKVNTEVKEKEDTNANIGEKVDTQKDTVTILLEAYHKILPMLPKTKLINAEIKKNAAELLKEVKPEAIIETFKMVPKCNHLIGKNDRGWQATFGWLMKPVNYAKVVNGNYLKSDKLPDVKPDAYNAQLNFLMNSVKKDYEKERMEKENDTTGTEENFYDHIVYGPESQICN